jgi:hypothetical protein
MSYAPVSLGGFDERKVMFKRLFIALLVVFGLAACNSGGKKQEPIDPLTSIEGTVEDYGGVAAFLDVMTYASESSLGSGGLKEDGSFSVELDEEIALDRLTIPLGSVLACTGLDSETITARGDVVWRVLVKKAGKVIGGLYQGESAEGLEDVIGNLIEGNEIQEPQTLIIRIYSTKNANVSGTCTPFPGFTVNTNLALKKGWNLVRVRVTIKDRFNYDEYTYNFATIASADDYNWFFIAGDR